MVRVAVFGATGRMGQLVMGEVERRADLELVAAVSRTARPGAAPRPVVALGDGCFGSADVVVDFSLPEGLEAALPFVGARALVSGTTGLDEALRDALRVQSSRGPVLWAANFSLGIHVLRGLVRSAIAALRPVDVEIVETHHRHKVDAPSGTARVLAADASRALDLGRGRGTDDVEVVHGRHGATGERPRRQIGVHAVRGGDVAGEHVVHLLADGERLALSHAASGRGTFARGAVSAAAWMAGRPAGWYSLDDVVAAERPATQ